MTGPCPYKMRFGNTSPTLISLHSSDHGVDYIDRDIDDYFVHPQYFAHKAYFDVGIAYSKKNIHFNSYIRPVCLPMTPVDDDDYLEGDFVTLSGWGVQFNPSQRTYDPSKKLKLHTLEVVMAKKVS